MVGFTATFLLPLRAGEFVRAYFLSAISPLSFSRSFGTIISERVFDILSLLLILYFGIQFSPHTTQLPASVNAGVQALGVIAIIFGGAMLFAVIAPRQLFRCGYVALSFLLNKHLRHLRRRLLRMAHDFIGGLATIKSISSLSTLIVLSLLVWLVSAFFYQAALWAMGVDAPLAMGIIVMIMIALLVAAPSAPGFIGTFQAGCVIALHNIYSLSNELAIAYSILTHALQALLVVAMGLFILFKSGLKLLDLTSRRQ